MDVEMYQVICACVEWTPLAHVKELLHYLVGITDVSYQ
jgi:hypothetical protein